MTQITQLYSAEEIATRIDEMAKLMALEVPEDIMVVGLLKGAFTFTADLVRAMDKWGLKPQVEFMRLSSYGNSKESSGEVLMSGGVPADIHGKHVLVVDDILDSGRTLAFTKRVFREHGAKSVKSCILLDKPSRREVDVKATYTGFEVEDLFVVGYGIDYAEKYRHLPYIGTVD
ncbi:MULTISPECIES: hypoxanthine phosphoribosyltransferase [Curvivirga]|uniref:hypoxanthine phosphoribosyltransferase n=1 Tax=Curvivirga TaxID=2856846 RepID=UPI0012BC1EE2|nr:hypoxanthine phosphoribosyltransferase [Curvivirga aplysinae]MTI08243.1 hypoxanthine phosphoribosyltransferase [Curvivirga aplysinae]